LIAFRVETLEAVDSTNDIIRERAAAGAEEGLVVRAEEQLVGRGRHGRVWCSPPGNLYVSLLFRPERPLAEAATLSLVVGLSLVDAIEAAAAPSIGLRLKWPNDVLAGEAKIAGILLETLPSPATEPSIVAGLGVNVEVAPEDMPYPTTTLRSLGVAITPEALLDRLLARIAADYLAWQAGGFAVIRDRWLARARGIGETVGVQAGERAVRGRFVDVDATGQLVLEAAEGRLTLNAGELFFVPSAAP
jgi:BirA family biotin operon repressor/biotin-[acetyl-CoA-carboxylase] ligase